MRLTKDQILARRSQLARETVTIPEWGGDVIVQEMNARDRDAWEKSILESETEPSLRNIRAKLVARSVVDEAGERLFSDEEAEQLGGLSGAAVTRVYSVAARLSRIRRQDVEELQKNSGTGQSAGSSSDSQAT